MGHIYFVRHGQTVWNVENKICGATDVALTELGHRQAIETGRAFVERGLTADEILYSPLSRAADTARHIAELTALPARVEPRLCEQHFGYYESTPRDGEAFREAKKAFTSRYGTGESILHAAQRIYNLLDELREQRDRVYILVGHNGIARVLHSYFHDMTLEEFCAFRVENCQILRYDFD